MSCLLRSLVLTLGAVALLSLAACGGTVEQPARELRRSLGGEPGTLDPQLAGDTYAYEVPRDAYEGLVTEDPTGALVPGQASGWRVSSDGREYLFTLRSGLRWSDGSPLVANDFVRGLRRAVDPRIASPNGPLLRVITGASEVMAGKWPVTRLGVSAPNPTEVVVRLEHPADFLPALLAHPVAYPYREGKPLFNGAYRLGAWTPGRPLRASVNEHYRAAREVAIRRVVYVGVADENVELLRYRAGAIDVTGGLPADSIAWARQSLPGQLQVASQAAVFFLGMNLRQGRLRDLPAVRRALSMTIDRDRLTGDVLRAGQLPAYGLVPPGIPNYQNSQVPWLSWTSQKRLRWAQAAYAAAGFSPTQPLRVRVLYNRNTTVRRAVLAIALMWRDALGVEVELVDEEFGRFMERRQSPEGWDVVRLGWNADYPDAASFLEVFQSASPENSTGFAAATYDAQLARALRSTGGERVRALATAEEELLAADVIVPVYFLTTRRLVRPNVVTGPPNLMNHNYTRHWRWAAPAKGTPPVP